MVVNRLSLLSCYKWKLWFLVSGAETPGAFLFGNGLCGFPAVRAVTDDPRSARDVIHPDLLRPALAPGSLPFASALRTSEEQDSPMLDDRHVHHPLTWYVCFVKSLFIHQCSNM